MTMDNQVSAEEQVTQDPNVSSGTEVAQETVAIEKPTIDWKATLDENIRNHPSLGNVKDVGTLAKNYVNAQELIGKKGVILPTKEDDVEGWNRVFKDLGRPDDAKSYAKPKIEVEDDYKAFIDESKFDKFAEIAHKYGLNQKQFEAISKEYTELQLQEIKQIVMQENQAKEEAKTKLMNEWGLNFDSKNSAAERALKAMADGIPEERLTQYKSDPFIKKMFAKVADSISEDKLVINDTQSSMSSADIKSEINRIITDKKGSYWNTQAIDHKETVSKVKDMYEALEKSGSR